MAQSYVTDAGTLIIPGAYPSVKVEASNSGLSTTGVLMLVGEADAGADFSAESDIGSNSFGPDQVAEVTAKYKSGPLVNAFRAATAAANDAQIQGSFSRAILVKTNASAKASSPLLKWDASSYGTLQDRSFGKLGNLIARSVVAKTTEAVPSTGSFAFLPPIASTNIDIRVNGGAATAIGISAQMTPAAFKAAVDAVAGVDVTGGDDLAVLGTSGTPLSGNISLTVLSGNTVRIDFSVNYGVVPAVGSTLWIPSGSVLADTSFTANAGAYIVTAATVNTLTARKLLDVTGTPAQLTGPVNRASVATATNTTMLVYSAMDIHLVAANPSDGIGKSLEISELTSGTGLLSYLCWTLGSSGPSAVTWISKAVTPYIVGSSVEYSVQLNASRQVDSVTEELSAGGKIALLVGYKGTSATLANDGTTLTISVVGGVGASPAPITLADYPTISDLATYIGTLPGFVAAPGTAVMGQQPSTSLDRSATGFPFGIATTQGGYAGRIKQDAYKFYTTLANEGILVELSARPAAGLPAPSSLTFMTGGTKGGTTDASFNLAIDALELVRGNFVIPCFSRSAVDDIADGITDTSSSYTIANIHAYTKSHVLRMSTLKRRRHRQAFLSIRDTFANVQSVSANIASYRCAMTFQDVKDAGAAGVVQFQPWMAGVKAASMQAAGFYRPIVRKGINISGALQAKGDFNDQNDSLMENALLAGLLPIRRDETGGYYWVSDQTTYGKDDNFVFNSIQATYISDVVALTTATKMERAFVGQSVADVSAALALSTLEAIMDDFKRIKLIAASDDAPKGFKNASIKIKGPSMVVNIEIKLAGSIYFVPISILVSQVSQSAG